MKLARLILFSALSLAACSGGADDLQPNPIVHRYATQFSATENPLSDNGAWHHTKNAFTPVRVENGVAHGTNGQANTFDDSYALLSGFGPDQAAEAVVYRAPKLARGITHEVELLLRMSDDRQGAKGYECLFAYFGGVQIMRWNGPLGNFTDLGSQHGPGRFNRELATGDIVKASIVGNVISLYINGDLIARTTDGTFATGQPGISFFTRPGGDSANFGLKSYSVVSN